jgi:hypothetical protein
MDWSSLIVGVVGAALGGGGIGGVLTIYFRQQLDRQQLQHANAKDHQSFLNEQNRQTMIGVLEELSRVRSRLEKAEAAYDEIRIELASEYAKDIKLQAEVNRLKEDNARVRRALSQMRGEHEHVTDEA